MSNPSLYNHNGLVLHLSFCKNLKKDLSLLLSQHCWSPHEIKKVHAPPVLRSTSELSKEAKCKTGYLMDKVFALELTSILY